MCERERQRERGSESERVHRVFSDLAWARTLSGLPHGGAGPCLTAQKAIYIILYYIILYHIILYYIYIYIYIYIVCIYLYPHRARTLSGLPHGGAGPVFFFISLKLRVE